MPRGYTALRQPQDAADPRRAYLPEEVLPNDLQTHVLEVP